MIWDTALNNEHFSGAEAMKHTVSVGENGNPTRKIKANEPQYFLVFSQLLLTPPANLSFTTHS